MTTALDDRQVKADLRRLHELLVEQQRRLDENKPTISTYQFSAQTGALG